VPDRGKATLYLTGLSAAFVFLQLCVLCMGNRTGEAVLPPERLELVYYAEQVAVLLGFALHAALRRRPVRRGLMPGALALLTAGAGLLLFARNGVAGLAALCLTLLSLGCVGGAWYLRMAQAAALGLPVGRGMGLGYAAAVALQYALQLWRGQTALLGPALLAAALGLFLLLRRDFPEAAAQPPGSPQPRRRLVRVCLITAALLLFTAFYNGYIHHLQIRSGDYNVYTWPRLMLIPGYLLFAALGDRSGGRLVPLAALCTVTAALLNAVLAGQAGADWLNMCLFYVAISASVSCYNLSFWRLAAGTKSPARWASMGRVLDSAMVLLCGALRVSALSAPAVLALDLGGLATVLVLMAMNGDLSLAPVPAGAVPAADPGGRPAGDPGRPLRPDSGGDAAAAGAGEHGGQAGGPGRTPGRQRQHPAPPHHGHLQKNRRGDPGGPGAPVPRGKQRQMTLRQGASSAAFVIGRFLPLTRTGFSAKLGSISYGIGVARSRKRRIHR